MGMIKNKIGKGDEFGKWEQFEMDKSIRNTSLDTLQNDLVKLFVLILPITIIDKFSIVKHKKSTLGSIYAVLHKLHPIPAY